MHAEPGPAPSAARERRLLLAAGLTTVTLVAEAVGGVVSGSLALLADAGHLLVDASALVLAWLGARMARRPADARRSFGYGRAEVLAGFVNALTLIALVAWIAWEAVERIRAPQPILSGVMLAVAVGGLLVNLVVLRVLGGHGHAHGHEQAHGHDHAHGHGAHSAHDHGAVAPTDLNLQGARLHVIGDLLGSVAAIVAALVVFATGWTLADPILSLLVALLVLHSGWRLLRRSTHILLEGVPEHLDTAAITAAIAASHAAIADVHHLHVWQLASGSTLATLHVRVRDAQSRQPVLASVQRTLREHFGIAHATVQVEDDDCAEADCSA